MIRLQSPRPRLALVLIELRNGEAPNHVYSTRNHAPYAIRYPIELEPYRMTRQLTRRTPSAGGRAPILVSMVLAGLALIGLWLVVPALRKGDKVEILARESPSEWAGQHAIPAIDAAAPADFKTATFALG
jgi:hypothetical protein